MSKKKKQFRRGGRKRLFPLCPRYGSHRFQPNTNRCPCGFQRPGTVQVEKEDPMIAYTFRLPAATLQTVEHIGVELSVGTSETIRRAVEEFIARHPHEDTRAGF